MAGAGGPASVGVVVYSDYVCPFCYLAEVPLSELRAEGVGVERRAFELRPAPHPLADLRKPYYRRTWEEAVQPLAARLGIEMRFPAHAVRTRKAHEAAAFARERGRLEEMQAALQRAYWVEGRDIGRIDVLVGIGEAVGLDGGELKVELDVDRWTERVEADEAEAVARGITGVPAFGRVAWRHGEETLEWLVGLRDATTFRRWLHEGSRMERET